MSEYTIIDAHIHTYQTREIGLQAKQGSTRTDYAGTLDEWLPIMEKAGIARAVMVNMLPLADMRNAALAKLPNDLSESKRRQALMEIDARMIGRLERRNSWTCGIARENPTLIPFINLDPLMDESTMIAELLDKVNNHGARGIKLHPASQQFFPGNHRLWPAYETAQRLRLPVIFHAGVFPVSVQYARPKNFVEVLESFPNLTLVMAHLGMGFPDEVTSMAKTYPNLMFDCSAIISATATEGEFSDSQITGLVKKIGVDRVIFGSDFPWYDPAEAVARLLRLDFSEQEKRMLLAENAVRIYGLSK